MLLLRTELLYQLELLSPEAYLNLKITWGGYLFVYLLFSAGEGTEDMGLHLQRTTSVLR